MSLPTESDKDLREILATLHELTAEQLLNVLKTGIPVKDDATGAVHYEPAPAAYFAQAIQLLKHNNIQAPLAKSAKPRGALAALADYDPAAAHEDSGLPFAVFPIQ